MPDILPNSKPRHRKVDWNISRCGAEWIYIFCANCGKDGGRVLENQCDFAFYLCDSCAETYGHIPGTMMVPDELFWQQVAERNKEMHPCLSIPRP